MKFICFLIACGFSSPLSLADTADNPLQLVAELEGNFEVVTQFGYDDFTLPVLPEGAKIERAFLLHTACGNAGTVIPASLRVQSSIRGNILDVPQFSRDMWYSGGNSITDAVFIEDITSELQKTYPQKLSTKVDNLAGTYRYGDFLILVFSHASMPYRNLHIFSGVDYIRNGTLKLSFNSIQGQPGMLSIVTIDSASGGEDILKVNGKQIASGDLFKQQGNFRGDVVKIPFTTRDGSNSIELNAFDDGIDFVAFIVSAEPPVKR